MIKREMLAVGWEFARVREGWQWHRLGASGELHVNGSGVFATLLECLEDAKRHGYSVCMPASVATPNRLFGD